MEETVIIEIWDIFREYIPEKSRETAATQFVDFLVGQDVETDTFESLLGFDPNLDIAIKLVLDEDSEDDYEEDEDNEEDEDY